MLCRIFSIAQMLFEQGCEQCAIWTGQLAPRAKIAAALLRALFTHGSIHPAHEKMEPLTVLPRALVQAAALGSSQNEEGDRAQQGEMISGATSGPRDPQ